MALGLVLGPLAGCGGTEGEDVAADPGDADSEVTVRPEAPAPAVSEDPPLPETGTQWRRLATNAGAWTVHWRPTVEPIPLNEPFGLQVAVTDAGTDAAAPDDVDLLVDARMPDHRHGMLREPTVTAAPHGAWIVEGMQLHMPGYWEFHFDIVRGARTERAQAPIELD